MSIIESLAGLVRAPAPSQVSADDLALLCRSAGMADPDQIDGIDALREELRRANRALLRLASQLQGTNQVFEELAAEIGRITVAYLRGDGAGVYDELAAFVQRRLKLAAPALGGVQ